jgi:2-oxoglutarate ferredoxin oxidoreductase subunit alpha
MAREKGIKVGLMRPTVLWPFPEEHVRRLGESVKTILVPELNMGQMAHEVEWATGRKCDIVKLNRIDGEPISPFQILETITEVSR